MMRGIVGWQCNRQDIIQASRGAGMDQNARERERIIAQTIEEAADLVELILQRDLPPEDFPDHIRGMSLYAERD